MTESELLTHCQNYFKQAQNSWDTYFAKWEEMAKNEDMEENVPPDEDETSHKKRLSKKCKKDLVVRKIRDRAIATLNNNNKASKKKSRSDQRSEVKCKENHITPVRSNSRSDCGTTAEDNHLEVDLKKIFIEIMSERDKDTNMVFSVLSRTLSTSGTRDEIGSLSRGLVTMKKTEVSMETGGMKATTQTTTTTVLQSGRNELCSPRDVLASCKLLERPMLSLDSPRRRTDNGWDALLRPPIGWTSSPSPSCQKRQTALGRSPLRSPAETLSAAFPSSPFATSATITTPAPARGKKRKSLHRMSERLGDDEDDSEESDDDEAGNSPTKCPKISCTPKRLAVRRNKKLRGENETIEK